MFEANCLKGTLADRSLVRARQRRIVAPTVFVLMPHNDEQTPLLIQQLVIAPLCLQVQCTLNIHAGIPVSLGFEKQRRQDHVIVYKLTSTFWRSFG